MQNSSFLIQNSWVLNINSSFLLTSGITSASCTLSRSPTARDMFWARSLWSPVIIFTWTPYSRARRMVSAVSARGGSRKVTMPSSSHTSVASCSRLSERGILTQFLVLNTNLPVFDTTIPRFKYKIHHIYSPGLRPRLDICIKIVILNAKFLVFKTNFINFNNKNRYHGDAAHPAQGQARDEPRHLFLIINSTFFKRKSTFFRRKSTFFHQKLTSFLISSAFPHISRMTCVAPFPILTSFLTSCLTKNPSFLMQDSSFLMKIQIPSRLWRCRLQNPSFLIQNSSFFNAQFLDLNAQFLIFTHPGLWQCSQSSYRSGWKAAF